MISIVIPSYNYAHYLPDAVHSVIQQGIEEIEIIICDDSSTDNTQEVARALAKQDKRIRCFFNKKNLGATGNINQAVKHARGEYLLLLGADDMLVDGSLRILKQALITHPECAYAFGRYTFLDHTQQSIPLQHPGWLDHDYFATRDELPNLLRFDCYINMGATLFRTALFAEQDFFDASLSVFDTEPFFRATDWDKMLRLSMQSLNSAFINQNMAIFRLHNEQASANERYGQSGLAFFEHTLLLERYLNSENIERLLPYLADIVRLYQSKFEYFHRHGLPEYAERLSLAERKVNTLLNKIEHIVTTHAQRTAHNFTESTLPTNKEHGDVDPKQPFFSIIVTSYNRPQLLINALQSIAAQNYKDFELILVNDGGVWQESVLQWVELENPVTYIRSPNRGVAAARNLALRLARGQYVVYLDDDDIMYSHHLARLQHEASKHPNSLVFGNAHFITEQVNGGLRTELQKGSIACQQFDFNRLQITNYIPINVLTHPLPIIDQVGGFDETLASHEDWDLLIRLSRHIPFIHFNDTTVQIRRRMGPGQEQDSRTARAWQGMRDDYMIIYHRYPDLGIQEVKDGRERVLAVDHPTQAGLNFK